MLDTFKARLKAKTKAAGVNLSTKRIDAYADRLHKKNPDVKDDAEHDALIDALDELVSFADVAKQDDQVRTLEAKVKAKPAATTSKKEDEDEGDDDEDDEEESAKPKTKKEEGKEPKAKDRTPKWAKDLMEEVKGLKAEKAQNAIDARIAAGNKGEDGKPKMPEKFLAKRVRPEKVDDVEAWLEEAESDWKEINPGSTADTGGKKASGHQPKRGNTKTDAAPSKEEIDKILE